MDRSKLISVIVLISINVFDAVMNAVIGPTLIFYIEEMGGTQDDYGLSLSALFLAIAVMTSVYGVWIDNNGNKYKAPYLSSFAFGIVSYTLYFFAIMMPKGPIAVYSILVSRLICGMAIAGRTLSYSWVVTAIEHEQQKTVMTFLSMSRTFGIIIGPVTNMLVAQINTSVTIFGGAVTIPLTPNNSIGLIMIGSEIFLAIVMMLFLQDPPEKETTTDDKKEKQTKNDNDDEKKGILYALTHFDIFFPVYIFFVAICIQTFLATAFPPIAKHAMEWNPVEISVVGAYQSAVMFIGMCLCVVLSMKRVSDAWMINFGFASLGVSGAAMYFLWTENVTYWQFTWPTYLLMFSYPFVTPSARSIYSKAIHSTPELAGSSGVMMSLLNQAVGLGGMIAPTVFAKFVLRDPAAIDADPVNKHELTIGALCLPVLSATVIAGMAYRYFFLATTDTGARDEDNDLVDSEATPLVVTANEKKQKRSSIIEISAEFSRTSEVNRRISTEINGITNPFDMKDEQDFREKLWMEKQEWERSDGV